MKRTVSILPCLFSIFVFLFFFSTPSSSLASAGRVVGVKNIADTIKQYGSVYKVPSNKFWILKYTKTIPSGGRAELIMDPTDAFNIKPLGNGIFQVSIQKAELLLDEYSMLRTIRAKVNISFDVNDDANISGRGLAFCEVFAQFKATGANVTLPLEKMSNDSTFILKTHPEGVVTFSKYVGTKAYYKRKMGDRTRVTIHFSFRGTNFSPVELPSCGGSEIRRPSPEPERQPYVEPKTRNQGSFALTTLSQIRLLELSLTLLGGIKQHNYLCCGGSIEGIFGIRANLGFRLHKLFSLGISLGFNVSEQIREFQNFLKIELFSTLHLGNNWAFIATVAPVLMLGKFNLQWESGGNSFFILAISPKIGIRHTFNHFFIQFLIDSTINFGIQKIAYIFDITGNLTFGYSF